MHISLTYFIPYNKGKQLLYTRKENEYDKTFFSLLPDHWPVAENQ